MQRMRMRLMRRMRRMRRMRLMRLLRRMRLMLMVRRVRPQGHGRSIARGARKRHPQGHGVAATFEIKAKVGLQRCCGRLPLVGSSWRPPRLDVDALSGQAGQLLHEKRTATLPPFARASTTVGATTLPGGTKATMHGHRRRRRRRSTLSPAHPAAPASRAATAPWPSRARQEHQHVTVRRLPPSKVNVDFLPRASA